MTELYWITRLSAINTLFTLTLILSILAATPCIITLVEDRDCDKIVKRLAKISISIVFISVLGMIFVPTTKEALLIYSVGGTIDYIKENPTAQNLPDKCIEALDKWVDSLNEETKNDD